MTEMRPRSSSNSVPPFGIQESGDGGGGIHPRVLKTARQLWPLPARSRQPRARRRPARACLGAPWSLEITSPWSARRRGPDGRLQWAALYHHRRLAAGLPGSDHCIVSEFLSAARDAPRFHNRPGQGRRESQRLLDRRFGEASAGQRKLLGIPDSVRAIHSWLPAISTRSEEHTSE